MSTLNLGAIGDSITAGFGLSAGEDPLTQAALRIVALGAFTTVNTTNQGVLSAQTSDWLSGSSNLIAAKSAFASASVTHVLIMLGANDAAAVNHMAAATYGSNLSNICSDLTGAGYIVILDYPTYIPAGANGGATDATSVTLTAAYLAQIDALVNGTTIVAGDKYARAVYQTNYAVLTQTDQTHPTAAGAVVLGTLWAQHWRTGSATIVPDSFSGSSATTVSSLTFAHTCSGSDRFMVVTVTGDSTDKITGTTYNGVAMTLLVKSAADDLWMYVFYLSAPASGAHNVVVSAGSASAFILASCESYTNVLQAYQPEFSMPTISSLAASASLTVTTTTLSNGAWVVLSGKGEAGFPTAGTGSTKRGDDAFAAVGVSAIFDSNAGQSPATDYAMTFTHASGANAIGGFSLVLAPSNVAVASSALKLTSALPLMGVM